MREVLMHHGRTPGARSAFSLLAILIACLVPAAASARSADTGIITVCNASGAHQASGSFTLTLTTVASAGGTTTLGLSAGACTGMLFYPEGVGVTVTLSAPPGNKVTAITLVPTKGKQGTTTAIASSNPGAGTANITVGSGDATLTFVVNGTGGPVARPCTVPNVFGLTLGAAKAALRKANCTVGAVRKVHSNLYYPGRVYSQSPPRGTVLGPRGTVGLTVSLGRG
jgi:hypothetical protein